jgi:hypothetical protein
LCDGVVRQCRRSVQRFEIRDQVGALGGVLQAGVDHRRVGHHRARIGEIFVEGGGVLGDAELLVVVRSASRTTASRSGSVRRGASKCHRAARVGGSKPADIN